MPKPCPTPFMPSPFAATAACLLLAALPAGAQVPDRNSPACAAALQAYEAMKARTTMEESQYAGTTEGSAVRSACGPATLADADNAALAPLRPRAQAPAPATSSPLVPPPIAPLPTTPAPAPAPIGPRPAPQVTPPPARIISPSPATPPGVRAVPPSGGASR